MSTEQKPEDVFQNLREGLTEISKRVGGFMEDVLSGEGASTGVKIRADLYYTRDQYVIELELPGVRKEDVSIQVHDGVLTIQGDKHPHPDAAGFDYEKQERRFGGFIRTFALPLNIQLDNIKAKYESGLLTIRFPKVAESAEDPGIPIE